MWSLLDRRSRAEQSVETIDFPALAGIMRPALSVIGISRCGSRHNVGSAGPASLNERRIIVDPGTFDGIIQRLSGSLTRRSVVGTSVLAALGLGRPSPRRWCATKQRLVL